MAVTQPPIGLFRSSFAGFADL